MQEGPLQTTKSTALWYVFQSAQKEEYIIWSLLYINLIETVIIKLSFQSPKSPALT